MLRLFARRVVLKVRTRVCEGCHASTNYRQECYVVTARRNMAGECCPERAAYRKKMSEKRRGWETPFNRRRGCRNGRNNERPAYHIPSPPLPVVRYVHVELYYMVDKAKKYSTRNKENLETECRPGLNAYRERPCADVMKGKENARMFL